VNGDGVSYKVDSMRKYGGYRFTGLSTPPHPLLGQSLGRDFADRQGPCGRSAM
jgi:hypothetical protein